jgi:hypothetical protein
MKFFGAGWEGGWPAPYIPVRDHSPVSFIVTTLPGARRCRMSYLPFIICGILSTFECMDILVQ